MPTPGLDWDRRFKSRKDFVEPFFFVLQRVAHFATHPFIFFWEQRF
jgi:hypothetical protein